MPSTNHPSAILPRLVAAVALVGIAVIHLLDLPSKLHETPYLGVLYILGPIAASLVAAALILASGRRFGWVLGGATALATFVGYCLSRTVGLPYSTDDIGNWGEPLGVVSLVLEGLVVLLAIWVIRLEQQKSRP